MAVPVQKIWVQGYSFDGTRAYAQDIGCVCGDDGPHYHMGEFAREQPHLVLQPNEAAAFFIEHYGSVPNWYAGHQWAILHKERTP